MKLLRRLIAWSFFAGLLTAVGVVVFHWVRYQPRFVVAKNHDMPHLSTDGRWLMTTVFDMDRLNAGNPDVVTRLHVYDTHSGQKVHSYNKPSDMFEMPWSPLGADTSDRRGQQRYVAGCEGEHTVIIDWQRGEQWTIPSVGQCRFSSTGRWLSILTGTDQETQPSTVVVDVAARRIARRYSGNVLGYIRNEQLAVCCVDKHKIQFLDMTSGEITATVESKLDLSDQNVIPQATRDGRWVALVRTHIPRQISALRDVEVWDLLNRRVVFRSSTNSWLPESFGVVIPETTRRCTSWLKTGDEIQIQILDSDNNPPMRTLTIRRTTAIDQLAEAHPEADVRQLARFSPDGCVFLIDTMIGGESLISAFETASGRLLWQKADFSFDRFIRHGEFVMTYDSRDSGLVVFDSLTGAEHVRLHSDIPMVASGSTPHGVLISMGGIDNRQQPIRFWDCWLAKFRPQWFVESRSYFMVVEPAAGREWLRLRGIGGNAILSDDGSKLATWFLPELQVPADRSGCDLQIWDVHPGRAWFWAVTVPIITGCVLLLLRRWRQKRMSVA